MVTLKEALSLSEQEIVALKDDFNTVRKSMTIDLSNFLIEWLKHHILIEDMKYVEFFNSEGIV